MIRAKLSNNTFLFGVDAVNIFKLMDGQPIHVDLKELGGHDRFIIMFGATYQDILDEIEKVTGQPMPEPLSEEELKQHINEERKA